jgi:ATP-dependent RNA helicase DDX5/DBP2
MCLRPGNIEDYIHRIGRTGRAGAKGLAISFFTQKSAKLAKDLVDILREARQVVPPDLEKMIGFGMGGGGRSRY